MANEITLSASLQIVKNGSSTSGTLAGKSITQAGDQSIGNDQIIGTSSEVVTVGDVSTIGYLYFKNNDSTNFVAFDIVNPCVAAAAPVHLLPGEAAVIPTRQSAWYGIADTSPCNCRIVAIEL